MQPAESSPMDSAEHTRAIPRLLIVRLSAMGDIIHALPGVAALRLALPETRFGWAVEERWAPLVRCACVETIEGQRPIVDELHIVNFKAWRHSLISPLSLQEAMGAVKALRASRYEVALDFQGAVRSSLLARLSGAPSLYGFSEPRENVASMFYTRVVLAEGKHVIQQNLSLASALVGRSLSAVRVQFSCVKGKCAPPRSDRYVILNPGAGWGAKQWPAKRYGEVARCLASQLGLRCLINAGPGEDGLLRAAQEASHGAAEPISCSPLELINLMRSACLLIGGDTGPMHLAAIMGIPVVAIFGPTDPARTGPFATRSIVLRNPDSRTTLSHETSPDRAMLEISTDDVVRAAMQLLGEHSD